MVRLAIIDLGTNSIRLDVHHFSRLQDAPRLLHREKLMVRLGEGLFEDRLLRPDAMERTLAALRRFRYIGEDLEVSRYVAFGTASLRAATNAQHFISKVEEETEIPIRVISGDEEATLIAEGVLENESIGDEPTLLIDIGGGSTELSFVKQGKVMGSVSLDLGVARLQELFLKKLPPNPRDRLLLEHYIHDVLTSNPVIQEWGPVKLALGSSGTVRALGRILGKPKSFRRTQLHPLVHGLSLLSRRDLLKVPALDERRADLIVAGGVLLDTVLEWFNINEVRSTDYSLRDGILLEQWKIYQSMMDSSIILHIDDILRKAVGFGLDGDHLIRLGILADTLFKKLGSIHRLDPKMKGYLLVAAFFRETGKFIATHQYLKHSRYIVENLEGIPLMTWESKFLGFLMESLRREVKKKELDSISENVSFREFQALALLLRWIHFLDFGPAVRSGLGRIRVTQEECSVSLYAKPPLEFLPVRFQGFEQLFYKAFGRHLILRYK